MSILLLFVFTFALAALHVPIVSAMILGCLLYILMDGMLPAAIVAQRMAPSLDSFPLLAVPLFILAGNLLNHSGIAERIFDFADKLGGHIRGGLAHVNVVSSMIFSGMSGVAQADAAGLGLIEIRAMKKHGFPVPFSAAVTATSAIIGPIIPPSVIMVVYAVLAGVSVADLFLAGIVPGILLGFALMATIYILSFDPRLAMPAPRPRPSLGELAVSFARAIPALVAPAFLMFGLILGFATPTELGAITVVYALVLGVLYRELTFAGLMESLKATVMSSGVLLFLVAAAAPFAWMIAVKGVPAELAAWLTSLTKETWLILLILNIGLLIAGCFLETTAILIIAVPALFPLITQIGVDPVHFGLMVVFNLLIGTVTPPFGVILFIMMDITKESMGALVRALGPFYLTLFVMLGVITYVPSVSLWLPKTVNSYFAQKR